MNSILRNNIAVGVLIACAAALTAHAQTAVPGPGSTNATIDDQKFVGENAHPENPLSAGTPDPKEEGSDGEAAGTDTPTYGDGSADTETKSPTQPIQGGSDTSSAADVDCTTFSGSEKEACDRKQRADQDKIKNQDKMKKVKKQNQLNKKKQSTQ